jgi:hypothetical protein
MCHNLPVLTRRALREGASCSQLDGSKEGEKEKVGEAEDHCALRVLWLLCVVVIKIYWKRERLLVELVMARPRCSASLVLYAESLHTKA